MATGHASDIPLASPLLSWLLRHRSCRIHRTVGYVPAIPFIQAATPRPQQGKSDRMRSIVSACAMASALLVSGLAQGHAVSLADEYQKKIKAATEISALGSGMFGETVSEATGKTVFAVVDIDLPGNNALPVRFGRRLPIDQRYISEELGGLGNWDIDVPYIEGTFSKHHGWTVPAAHAADRAKRCSMPGWPAVEGQIFMPNEVFHGYNLRVPGVYEGQMLAEANAYVDPADGVSYPWILESVARLSCLPSLKNGVAGE